MSACSIHTLPQGPKTPIKVNGVAISRALISREVQNHPAASPIAAWKAAALALVLKEALAQEVRRLGVAAEPRSDAEGRRETEDEARMRALVEREAVTPEPTREDCRRYYDANRSRFRSQDLFEAAHILLAVRSDDEAALLETVGRAQAMHDAVERDPSRFAELARANSACPSGAVDGNLGQITADQVTPAFAAALGRMEPGEVIVLETRYGLHVVRLDRKIEGRELPFELVEGHIAAYLAASVRRRAEAQYVARLLASTRIEGLDVPTPHDLNVH